MLNIFIPGFGEINLDHLVLDYNGTIAKDGFLIQRTKKCILALSEKLTIHVLTADTFGTVAKELYSLPVKIEKLEKIGGETDQKRRFVDELGAERTVAIGNGYNDEGMLKTAKIAICIVGGEGCSNRTLQNSDLVVTDIVDALELFIYPERLKATLRH
ncbi:HAD family hydrolase [Alkalibacter mobilis]|uniref:HAD family hydrolase n=1 Tax=Alkalibacter mobilis TaxID=2787712 RepID=UPI00189FF477|nr:haloacid dehalogenase [Alkalibacter mobilis]MBF7096293.1 haloacid dehalogenase [Alkalibacter mobilis]